MRLTAEAHRRLSAHLRPGDRAVDATLGNGHDTLFLAEKTAPSGRVFGFDIQPAAVGATRRRLAQAGVSAELHCADHARMADFLPAAARERIAAVVFNLGYLPGGDHALVTRASSTRPALRTAWEWLAPGGVISLLAYRGHPGGMEEFEAVSAWISECERRVSTPVAETVTAPGDPAIAPVLLWLKKP